MISYFIVDTTKVLLRKRLLAQAIDCVLVFLIAIVLVICFRSVSQLFFWIMFWVYLIYSVLMDAYRGGTTGKLYMGLKVVVKVEGPSLLFVSFYRNFKVFKGKVIPELRTKKENIDIQTLDKGHIIPNMKDPTQRGVWFPIGYE